MSTLTYKIKHNRDFINELLKAKQVAKFTLENKSLKLTSKNVKHFGLQSAISCQIIRKIVNNKKIKRISSVKLIVPGQAIKYKENNIWVSCLKLNLEFNKENFLKINQIELDNQYAYICCTVNDLEEYKAEKYIGVDRNATGHIAVCALGNKIIKLGKKAFHTHNKYKSIRRNLQKKGKFNLLKKIKNRESRITRDINHKVSRKIVSLAKENNVGIKLEELKGITKKKKQGKKLNGIKSNWSFYQLAMFIEYKAKLFGVPVAYVDPYNTSKTCSKCGLIGERDKKLFKCLNINCKHVDHADSNAAFNIAKGSIIQLKSKSQLSKDRDLDKGSNGSPQLAMNL